MRLSPTHFDFLYLVSMVTQFCPSFKKKINFKSKYILKLFLSSITLQDDPLYKQLCKVGLHDAYGITETFFYCPTDCLSDEPIIEDSTDGIPYGSGELYFEEEDFIDASDIVDAVVSCIIRNNPKSTPEQLAKEFKLTPLTEKQTLNRFKARAVLAQKGVTEALRNRVKFLEEKVADLEAHMASEASKASKSSSSVEVVKKGGSSYIVTDPTENYSALSKVSVRKMLGRDIWIVVDSYNDRVGTCRSHVAAFDSEALARKYYCYAFCEHYNDTSIPKERVFDSEKPEEASALRRILNNSVEILSERETAFTHEFIGIPPLEIVKHFIYDSKFPKMLRYCKQNYTGNAYSLKKYSEMLRHVGHCESYIEKFSAFYLKNIAGGRISNCVPTFSEEFLTKESSDKFFNFIEKALDKDFPLC